MNIQNYSQTLFFSLQQ